MNSMVHGRHIVAVRRRVGRLLQGIGYRSGVMGLWRGGNSGAVILMFHTVADGATRAFVDPRNHVPADVFAAQMSILAQRRRVVSLSEILDTLELGRTPPAGTVAITFDDGYLDNLTVAAPILAELGLPATLFLPTAIIDRQETQWVDQVWMAFRDVRSGTLHWIDAAGSKRTFELGSPAERLAAREYVGSELLTALPDERRQLLERLREQLPGPVDSPTLTMSWSDVQSMIDRYPQFEIGGHTAEHLALTAMDPAVAAAEVQECMETIAARTGRRPQHFSFPYGRTSEPLRTLVREAGFRSACGSGGGRGPVLRAGADPFALPRVEAPPSMRRFALLTDSVNCGIWRRLGR